MVSDETAYRKYLAGDEAAAQLLVERYGDALTLYINGVLGDIHEAEDLMIEAFAHIFARERPIQDGCFKAYLYKTGRNLALRCKTRRRFFLPLEELPFELPDEALAETGLFQNEQHHGDAPNAPDRSKWRVRTPSRCPVPASPAYRWPRPRCRTDGTYAPS